MPQETLVCEACHMKIPSTIHAQAHLIVHGWEHEAVMVLLNEKNQLVLP